MRSLLQQTTLAITAVLVLISCATQTQAVDGELEGDDNPLSYGRQFMDRVAASNGLSKPVWYKGGRSDLSFATVVYNNNQPGFLKCTFEGGEKAAFTRLELARENLKGINVAYRNYVALPVGSVPVPESESPSKQAGNCFVYRFVNGIKLRDYALMKNYADRLIAYNQIMPQILKGSIYLYNAGIIHKDLSSANIMVYGQTPEQLSASIIDFDMIGLLPDTKTPLVASILSQGVNPSTTGSYLCDGFNKAPLKYILSSVNKGIVSNPQMNPNQIRRTVAQRIQQTDAFQHQNNDPRLAKAIDAYISLAEISKILSSSTDCTGLMIALTTVYGPR
ncbi:hypothetical protein BDF22DRAFT_667725 [Syncephalis plumigaleata]|nr:hypothetical protein BDF22DRAFT_667725 [Syncephalis plumigaleata]